MRQLGLTQEARCAREVFAPCSAEARAVTGHAHTRWGEPGTRGWKDLKAAEAMGFMLSAPGRTSGEDEGGRDLRKAGTASQPGPQLETREKRSSAADEDKGQIKK